MNQFRRIHPEQITIISSLKWAIAMEMSNFIAPHRYRWPQQWCIMACRHVDHPDLQVINTWNFQFHLSVILLLTYIFQYFHRECFVKSYEFWTATTATSIATWSATTIHASVGKTSKKTNLKQELLNTMISRIFVVGWWKGFSLTGATGGIWITDSFFFFIISSSLHLKTRLFII